MAKVHGTPTSKKFVDITGQTFSKLTVVEFAGWHGTQLQWVCICECGKQCVKYGTQLKYRANQDCGCARRRAGEARRLHPVEYRHWRSMKTRCLNPKSDSWKYYGQKGIGICERWNSFAAFIADMGPMPTELHQIDRIDNGLDYCKENCRWASPKEQCNNRSSNTRLTLFGETKTLQQWCDITGIKSDLASQRISRGWNAGDAVTLPPRRRMRKLLS